MALPKSEIKRFQRYRGYDYSRGAAVFVTIVTSPRRRLFGEIVNARLVKTPLGEEVERALLYEAAHTPGLRLYKHVVMPDHVHFRVYLEMGLKEPLKTLGWFVRRFKTWTTRQAKLGLGLADGFERGSKLRTAGVGAGAAAGGAGLAVGAGVAAGEAGAAAGDLRLESRAPLGGLWQQGYHDWLCLSREMIEAVDRYIDYNPLKYELRYNQPAFLALREPLFAQRLSPDEFWRGVGAIELLDGDMPMIALRLSRRLSARQVDEAVGRIRRRTGDYVFVSGWISPGEKAVRDMLLSEPQGRIVSILPSAMSHDYRPGSAWLPAVRDRRAAIVARGNSEVEFSRAACLEVNDMAAKIATQAECDRCGKAVYWLPEGPKVIN